MKKDLKETAFPVLLQEVSAKGRTGALEITSGNTRKRIYFENGKIVHAASSNLNERLGEYLLRNGKISRDVYEKASKGVASGNRFGEFLLSNAILTPEELWDSLAGHLFDIILDLFSWEQGEYRFLEDVELPAERIGLNISVQDVIVEGIRHVRDWHRIMLSTGSMEGRWTLTEELNKLTGEFTLHPEEWSLLTSFRDGRSLREACEASTLDDFKVHKAVWTFKILGFLRQVEAPQGEKPAEAHLEPAKPAEVEAPEDVPEPPSLAFDQAGQRGKLQPLAFPDLLRSIYLARKTGVLELSRDGEACQVFFSHGSAIFARAGRERDRLGIILLKMGKLSREDVDRVLSEPSQGRKFGRIVVEKKLVSERDIQEAIELQIREVVLPVFEWTSGAYDFKPGVEVATDEMVSSLSTAELILEGIRSLTHFEPIHQLMHNLNPTFRFSSDPHLLMQKLALSPAEGFILSRADGNLSMEEICSLSPLGEEATCRVLYGLTAAGVLEITSEAAGAEAEGPPVLLEEEAPGEPEKPEGLYYKKKEELLALRTRLRDLDHYQVLGVDRASSAQEIKKSFFKKIKNFHPDNTQQPELKEVLEEIFARMVEARDALMDARTRQSYDLLLAHEEELSPKPPEAPGDQKREVPAAAIPRGEAAERAEGDRGRKKRGKGSEETETAAGTMSSEDAKRYGMKCFQSGKMALKMRDYWKAVTDLRHAVNYIPDNIGIRFHYAIALSKNPKWRKEAEKEFLACIAKSPWECNYYVELGVMYKQAGLIKKAMEQFEKALSINPNFERAKVEIDPSKTGPNTIGNLFKRFFSARKAPSEKTL